MYRTKKIRKIGAKSLTSAKDYGIIFPTETISKHHSPRDSYFWHFQRIQKYISHSSMS